MKRMLINATQPEELRVALVDGQRLYDLDIESTDREQKKSNIYKAKIIRIEPSLEAAFLDYGADRHGFLPLKEVARSYFRETAADDNKVNIKDVLKDGQELVVQVEKEERGNKGAALTTFISLAGRYLVAMPNNPRAGGVSRQIEGTERDEAREAMSQLEIPAGMGVILRTAGVGKSADELQWDLDYLLQLWGAIDSATEERNAPFLAYQDQNVIIRSIRDYLRADISEILIDDDAVHEQACEFMEQVMPQNLTKLKAYTDQVPLFTRYQIESQIESAFSREVRLPAGGSLVVEPTEALTTIDINSARATKGGDIEETALQNNLEAAEEIARQLRIRDLGGLIVIDFIDMVSQRNQRAVETRLREGVKLDRARIQVGRISRFGLLEMSRQRLRPSLAEFSHIVCPRCNGLGTIRGIESLALSILRIIEEEAMKPSTTKIIVQLPVDTATFLLNEKREDLYHVEERLDVDIVLVPNPNLQTPHYRIERVREQDPVTTTGQTSSSLIEDLRTEQAPRAQMDRPVRQEPAVKHVTPSRPKPKPPGFFKRLLRLIIGTSDKTPARTTQRNRDSSKSSNRRRRSGGSGRQSDSNRARSSAKRSGQSRNRRPDATDQKTADSSKKPSSGRRRGRRGGEGNRNRNDNRGEQNAKKAEQTETTTKNTNSEIPDVALASSEQAARNVNDSNPAPTVHTADVEDKNSPGPDLNTSGAIEENVSQSPESNNESASENSDVTRAHSPKIEAAVQDAAEVNSTSPGHFQISSTADSGQRDAAATADAADPATSTKDETEQGTHSVVTEERPENHEKDDTSDSHA